VKGADTVHQNTTHRTEALDVRREKPLGESGALSSIKLDASASTMGDGAVRSVESRETKELRCEQSQ
jgi:hypothetical protein